MLWLLAGVVDRRRRHRPARPRRRLPVAPYAADHHPGLGRRDPRRAARRQGREPDRRHLGQPRARRPDHARRVRRHPVRAQRHAQHRDRGQVPGRRVRGVDRRERDRQRADRRAGGDLRRRARRPAAGLARDPLQGRPDHRRRRDQHRRARDHQLPVPAGPVEEHRAEHAADDRGDPGPGPQQHPGPRAAAVLRDALSLLHDLR